MPTSYCHTHNVEEYVGAEIYRVCNECGHVYERGADLVEAHNDLIAETTDDEEDYRSVAEANEIYSCPMCGHDW